MEVQANGSKKAFSKQDRSALLIIMLVSIMLVLIVSGLFVMLGKRGIKNRIRPGFLYEQAQGHFENQEYFQGLEDYFSAYRIGIEAEIRWQVAEIPLSRMRQLAEESDYSQALKYCTMAVRIVGKHDSEGVIGYRCYIYDMFIDLEACQTDCDGECVPYMDGAKCVES